MSTTIKTVKPPKQASCNDIGMMYKLTLKELAEIDTHPSLSHDELNEVLGLGKYGNFEDRVLEECAETKEITIRRTN
jgi:hypothetical protein